MIKTTSELINAIFKREKEILDKYDISHNPTIGDMYEGCTKHLLELSLPPTIDLRVVTGFIVDKQGNESKQLDLMIVNGEGESIPYTDKYKYQPENVIAVIEVKKTLNAEKLDEGYQNLLSVKRLCMNNTPCPKMLSHAYLSITQKKFPNSDEIESIPVHLKQIYKSLYEESLLPVRAIIGYNGWSTEKGLREAFVKYLENHLCQPGFGPSSLPNLISSNNNSLVKMNGMPYVGHMNIQSWPLIASYSHNPWVNLIEMVWTKISYLYGINSSIFGEDLEYEGLNPLIETEIAFKNGQIGWNTCVIPYSTRELKKTPAFKEWAPVEISESQWVVINKIDRGGVNIDDDEFRKYIMAQTGDLKLFIQQLLDTKLVNLEGAQLIFTTQRCITVILPNGKSYAGENNSGQMERWARKMYDKLRFDN